jgi:hypothetical protein
MRSRHLHGTGTKGVLADRPLAGRLRLFSSRVLIPALAILAIGQKFLLIRAAADRVSRHIVSLGGSEHKARQ